MITTKVEGDDYEEITCIGFGRRRGGKRSYFSGRGSVIGALLGAFALSGIQSFLVIEGVQPQWYILLLGVLIVLAILAERRLHALVTR